MPGPAIFTPTPEMTKMPAPMIWAIPMTTKSRRVRLRLKAGVPSPRAKLPCSGFLASRRRLKERQLGPE
jgi:hypothetical protein